jgi:Glycosyl hydrolase family 26
MWPGRRLLALGLAAAFAAAGLVVPTAALASPAASINPSTWAPAGPGVYFFDRSGTGGGSPSDFSTVESQFGRKFDGHLYYLPAQVSSSDLADAHWSLAVDHVPFVVLSWSTGNNPNSIIPDIAAGKYDSDINGFANAVKAELSPYGRILIRPFWEFNFTGSEWNDTHYGGNASEFIAAWRRFVDIFRRDNVSNVKWLWNPIRVGGNQAQDPLPYYPGSSYVDWIGIDAYPKNTWLTLDQLATTSGGTSNFDWYDTFKSYGKPLMFGEVGILPANLYGGGAPTRATWWNDALSELQNQLPAVKAIEYFDSSTGHNWTFNAPGSAPGDSGADALAAARQFASSCFADVLSSACAAHPRHHHHHHHKASPSASPSPSPSPTASRSHPPVSAPASNQSPLGAVLIILAIVAVIAGTVVVYLKLFRRTHIPRH